MINIKNIKTHELLSFAFIHIDKHKSKDNEIVTKNVLVTDAELVLVHTKNIPTDDAVGTLVQSIFGLQIWTALDQAGYTTITGSTHIVKPILISRTEKIEVGDWYYNFASKKINRCEDADDPNDGSFNSNNAKILALPEHFSPQQLQDIVDSKLIGKCLVECKKSKHPNFDAPFVAPEIYNENEKTRYFFIKLNPHITIYNVEDKTYTLKDLEKAFNAGKMRYSGCGSTYNSFPTFQDFVDNKEHFWDDGICWTKKKDNGLK